MISVSKVSAPTSVPSTSAHLEENHQLEMSRLLLPGPWKSVGREPATSPGMS